MKKDENLIKKFWGFLHEDSWPSFIVTLLVALVFIKWIFFPALSLITGTALPLVIVESCSMYHEESGLNEVFSRSQNIYEEYGLSIEDTDNWIFQNGFNKGDIIFVVGPDNIRVGDVIIFNGGAQHPLIHRVIQINNGPEGNIYTTKGDNNQGLLPAERAISEDQLIGKALFKIPGVGWAKLIFFEGARPVNERGFCD